MAIKKVKENVYIIDDGSTRGNVTAYVLPSQIIFIDSGMNLPIVRSFREKIESETGKKVTKLFITHTHGDHVFGNQVFADCDIIASKYTNDCMIKNYETDWTPEKIEEWKKSAEDPVALEGLEIKLPTDTFDEVFELIDGEVKVIVKRTGGHTEGSSYVYCPNYKVLTAGDNLFIDSFPWGGDETADPIKWMNALTEYLALDVEYYLPGHGLASGKAKIQEFQEYLQKVVSLMKEMIAENSDEEDILNNADQIEYHPPRREQWKTLTLKKWYEVISQK
ncbi:MAG TPA: MBL fold metallo-hydrolase [candidate division Zixibacteria bacterium]|nr:MBL fold metallo-hydrolase [candidate division Zixibacteria bacterium]